MAADLLESEILRLGADNVAAFIGEPVQGAGGAIVPPDDYWPRIREICDRYEVLLIADEVMTGFGRSGDMFALERYGVVPDLLTFAKAITSGYLPLGGLGVSDTIAAAIEQAQGVQAWTHSYTYSAHPTACAVALANLDIIEREGLVARAGELGERLLAGLRTLESHPHVGEVRGLGMMAAVELVADKTTKAMFDPADKIGARIHMATQRLDSDRRGMFTRLRGDCYLFGPPFVTTELQIDEMVENLGDAIVEVLGS
jgi:adenosylmethionine-8-amino-7-oxononanoate aminotransferase